MELKETLFGLDNKINKINLYCKEFLVKDEEFAIAKEKLSITPTFLFNGLPGTGKTTVANIVYQELKKEFNIDFYNLRIDELISFNFGESSKNLIKFFKEIEVEIKENNSFAFVVIDELDSFTVNRFQNENESIKRILLTFNTIIDEMFFNGTLDKFILIATTNMKESIDASVLRRFFFHENFNIILDRDNFFNFIDEIRSVSNYFISINSNNKDFLYDIYQTKKLTLGEFKTIFAQLYIESRISEKNHEIDFKVFSENKSFHELLNIQSGG